MSLRETAVDAKQLRYKVHSASCTKLACRGGLEVHHSLISGAILPILRQSRHPIYDVAGMSDENLSWQETSQESSQIAEQSPSLQSPNQYSDSTEPWMVAEPPNSSTNDGYVPAAKIPPLTLPVPQHTEAGTRAKVATTVPPDTPELAEAGPSAPAYASRKPPRPFSRQSKQYERSNLGNTDHVPVNWIGDSTDHAGYRPTNTASFNNHEPDIVRVATFSTQGHKHDDANVHESQKRLSRGSSKRKWPVWALLGMVAGTAIGVAYKLLGDEAVVRRSEGTKQYCAAAFSHSKSQVSQMPFLQA